MRNILIAAAAFALTACSPPVGSVPAVLETPPVSQADDAADDPAIWVANDDPARSVVIATQKKGGLYIYDLDGAIVQDLPGGEPNNVDIREGFAWADGAAPIVGASDRSDNTIVLWRFDPETRQLDPAPRARIATGFVEVYGFCLGRIGGDYIAIVTDRDSGDVGVWRIVQGGDGALAGERIGAYSLGSIAEGCVVDDDNGAYYVAQELEGIWRVDADDAAGAGRRLIDRVGRGGNLVADVEGLALWRGEDGGGYLIASVQGASRYAVYDRGGDNAYRGAFRIGPSADGRVDGVQGTDGIDVVSTPLPGYPRGLFVAQDDENTDPPELQNFKYVSWAEVETLLGLR
ncbi:MAG: phytase [Hyphomonadaceae bacterium]|nr:phytase [Hyphomonadaceae bacterium]GIK49558.1 MAG: hypothetical protein BroJett013_22550 [Alphaproteobacteria bacterium]